MKDTHIKRNSSISLTKFHSLKVTSSLGQRRFSSNQLQIHTRHQSIAKDAQLPLQNKIVQISSRDFVLHHKISSAYRRRPKEDLLNNQQKAKMKQALFLRRKQYRYYNMVGKGGFGKVWKVQHQQTGQIFAMKQMSKAVLYLQYTAFQLKERIILANLNHKFISKMLYAFQDEQNLYIVMNLIQGGDLRYHLSKHTIFTEGQTKFMITSILLALEYLHSRMIIHRDVKPQNIVFDCKGYAHLTDFGISKYFRNNNKEDTSGTPGYMAPEVLFHQNHGFEVDFYAVGVILYEIMMGKRPYDGRSREQVKQQIKSMQQIIHKKDIPDGWSVQAADFANQLLKRKAIERLGWGGIKQVKQHPWLINFPWKQQKNGKLLPPKTRHYDFSQVKYRPTEKGTQFCRKIQLSLQKLQQKQTHNIFKGYEYNYSQCRNMIRIHQN